MKRILCLCHDVTDADIARAVRLGYRHPETVKRFTGALTGPCQGRSGPISCCGPASIAAIHGRSAVTSATVDGRRLACDLVVIAGPRRAADELARQADVGRPLTEGGPG